MPKTDREFLKQVLSQPSAPYREAHVIATLRARLSAARVPHFLDPVGNIVVGAESERDYKKLLAQKSKANEPLRIFIAHMDHPGFHGKAWKSPTELEFQWHGGSPTRHLEGAPVWLGTRAGWAGEAEIATFELTPSGMALARGTLRLEPALGAKLSQEFPDPQALFGGFRFRAPVWEEGDVVYTKAADDLVGAFAIVATACKLWKKKKAQRPPFIGLLTRAEEVGFIGAIGHFELGWLAKAKRELLVVSLETSRTLPGAIVGKGPIVRLGDRATVFDAGALRVFSDLALKLLPEKHQRRIMDAGTCEATAATAYGIPSIGISIPLGNYHNQGFEGGPDCRGPEGPAPEFVHYADIEGMLALCLGLMKPGLPWHKPWETRTRGFAKSFRAARALLKYGHAEKK